MTYQEMIETTRAAISARNAARAELAKRLEEMLDDLLRVLGGTVVVGGYRIEWVTAVTAEAVCSEWVTLITAGPGGELARSFGAVDLGHFDGHNLQRQMGHATYMGRSILPATVAMLRDVAKALPAVVAQSLTDCQRRLAAETATAQETLAALS